MTFMVDLEKLLLEVTFEIKELNEITEEIIVKANDKMQGDYDT